MKTEQVIDKIKEVCRRQRISSLSKSWWASMTPEQRAAHCAKLSDAAKSYYKKVPGRREAIRNATLKRRAEGKFNGGPLTDDGRRRLSEYRKKNPPCFSKQQLSQNGKKTFAVLKEKYPNHFINISIAGRAASAEEQKTNPRRGKFETNIHARSWHVRDPRGIAHKFRNLMHFIRNNEGLFQPDDLKVYSPTKKPNVTRAYGGISSIRPSDNRKRVGLSWKGWTWVYEANDRLQRNLNEQGGGL